MTNQLMLPATASGNMSWNGVIAKLPSGYLFFGAPISGLLQLPNGTSIFIIQPYDPRYRDDKQADGVFFN